MGPRWKRESFAAIAESNPMSQLVTQLQSFLRESQAEAMLSGCNILLEATPILANLLNRLCFGCEINTCENDHQWFQLGFEEGFYIHHELQSLMVVRENGCQMSGVELWEYMRSLKPMFPELYKAYFHLRRKNWVVRSGMQYGGDFVAYRHHPALVHSEFVVLVLLEDDVNVSGARLRFWSDLQCSLRVSGIVAKTLLVLTISKNGSNSGLPSCLDQFSIEENMIKRWVPEQCRDGNCVDKKENP